MLVATSPYSGFPAASPPRTSTRPSGRIACPAQKRFVPCGSFLIAPVTVSSTFAPAPSSKKSTRDERGNSTTCCMTDPPELTGALHWPVDARGSGRVVVVVVAVVLVGVAATISGGGFVAFFGADGVTGTHDAARKPAAAVATTRNGIPRCRRRAAGCSPKRPTDRHAIDARTGRKGIPPSIAHGATRP